MSNYFPIPDEILTFIFLKLPAKALLRCLCVCKLWNSFITNTGFISCHLDHHSKLNANSESRLFLTWHRFHSIRGPGRVRFSLNSLVDQTFVELKELQSQALSEYQTERYRLHVLGSCNGLTCLHNTLKYGLEIFLWNPTINRVVSVPIPPSSSFDKIHRQWYLMGFGFDPESNDYKLLRVTHTGEGPPGTPDLNEVEIYTLRTRTWRRIDHTAPPPNYYTSSRGRHQVYLNGVVHWIAHFREANSISNYSILWFDMRSEVFGEWMLPQQASEGSITSISIAIVEDALSFSCYNDDDGGKCCVWLMKEYGVFGSWTKRHCIDIRGYLPIVHEPSKRGRILLSLAEDKVHPLEVKLALYLPETGEIKYVEINGSCFMIYLDQYIESLVLLNM